MRQSASNNGSVLFEPVLRSRSGLNVVQCSSWPRSAVSGRPFSGLSHPEQHVPGPILPGDTATLNHDDPVAHHRDGGSASMSPCCSRADRWAASWHRSVPVFVIGYGLASVAVARHVRPDPVVSRVQLCKMLQRRSSTPRLRRKLDWRESAGAGLIAAAPSSRLLVHNLWRFVPRAVIWKDPPSNERARCCQPIA